MSFKSQVGRISPRYKCDHIASGTPIRRYSEVPVSEVNSKSLCGVVQFFIVALRGPASLDMEVNVTV